MEYVLVLIAALAFVFAVFWLVAKTVGELSVVKNSPTLDDLLNPELAEKRDLARQEYHRKAQELPEPVRALADKGDFVGATKTYREYSDASLKEAKTIIETYLSCQKKEP